MNNWKLYPNTEPTEQGEYLCRGIGGLNHKLHYYVCLWINEPSENLKGFFYGGDYFNGIRTGVFEYIKCSEL